MSEEIERLNKMRQDFVANVSHELRTPLTVIHGYVETLRTLYAQDINLLNIFNSMQEQTVRMGHLIEDLLLLAKIENESPEAEYEPVKLTALLAGLQKDMQQLGQQHTFVWELNQHLELLGNAHELRSAFSNLITNAIRYTPVAGKILVRTGVTLENTAFFSVEDAGVGIAAEHIPRLTERFYRVDKGRSRKSGGTGLGLAITKHVLWRHQAELKVVSEIGKGSTFTCLFPARRINLLG